MGGDDGLLDEMGAYSCFACSTVWFFTEVVDPTLCAVLSLVASNQVQTQVFCHQVFPPANEITIPLHVSFFPSGYPAHIIAFRSIVSKSRNAFAHF